MDSIQAIQAEHVSLDKVLRALEAHVTELTLPDAKPDFELLTFIVYYIRVYPDRMHHPKEEEFLFRPLRRRRPEAGAVIDDLERQHAKGRELIDALDAALKECEAAFPEKCDRLRAVTREYVDFQRNHMGMEERDVLPLARSVLTEEDRILADRAFATNRDPLVNDNLEVGFRALLDRIVRQ